MKKVLSLVMALAVMLSLVACGGNTDVTASDSSSSTSVPAETKPANNTLTKEELLASAVVAEEIEELKTTHLDSVAMNDVSKQQAYFPGWALQAMSRAKLNNVAAFNKNYLGKPLQITGVVTTIQSDYAALGTIIADDPNTVLYSDLATGLRIFLPEDDLISLQCGQIITVVGILEEATEDCLAEAHNVFMIPTPPTPEFEIDDTELQKLISDFGGDGGDDYISWTEGSYPFFIINRRLFNRLENEEITDALCGQWNVKHYMEPEKNVTFEFRDDFTAIRREDDTEYTWDWKIADSGTGINFPTGSGDFLEVRQVNENLIVFYENTINYVPIWILFKN